MRRIAISTAAILADRSASTSSRSECANSGRSATGAISREEYRVYSLRAVFARIRSISACLPRPPPS